MNEEKSFIDELIAEAEEKEELQTQAYFDLLLLEIQKLQESIANNFLESDREVEIIKQWALDKNSKLQNKIEWLEKKLESYIREQKVKTIEMPHGVLKFHKKPDRVEVTDLELFLKHSKKELLTIIPEQIKPDLMKIKAYIKQKHFAPYGVTIIEGKEEFSYKLNANGKEVNENGREEEIGIATESTDQD